MTQARMSTDGPFRKLFWPTIDDAESANAAAITGFAISAIIASITGLSAALDFNGANRWKVVDCFLFALIAWAIKTRMSRVAAVSGLAYYAVGKLYSSGSLAIAPAMFFALFFVTGIRGTFAYNRLLTKQPRGLRPRGEDEQ